MEPAGGRGQGDLAVAWPRLRIDDTKPSFIDLAANRYLESDEDAQCGSAPRNSKVRGMQQRSALRDDGLAFEGADVVEEDVPRLGKDEVLGGFGR